MESPRCTARPVSAWNSVAPIAQRSLWASTRMPERARLFRRHVRRRAEDGELHGRVSLRQIGGACDAEVEQLGASGVRQKDVVRLHVAMDETARMGRGEGVEYFDEETHRHRDWQRTSPHARAERLTLQQLHHRERDPVVGEAVVQRTHHAGMVDEIADLSLAREPIEQLAIADQVSMEHLDRPRDCRCGGWRRRPPRWRRDRGCGRGANGRPRCCRSLPRTRPRPWGPARNRVPDVR